MRRRTWAIFCAGLVLIALASLTIGCNGSSGGAKLRLVNATPDESSLDLLVDTKSFVSGVGYGAASAYTSIPVSFQDAISFTLLVVVLVAAPRGLPGLWKALDRRLVAR